MSSTAGQLVTETFDYDGGRQVTVYVPPEPADSVVFAADGGWHIARLGEKLEAAGMRSTMLVGPHAHPGDDEARLDEYSPTWRAVAASKNTISSTGVPDGERFVEHEKFFVDDVGQWVKSRFAVAVPAERTAVWGASAGGELALALGVRHPDNYGSVFCASPGGGYPPPDELPSPLPRFYLVAGDKERGWFLDHAIRWSNALRDADVDVVMAEREGGHGGDFWFDEFPLMAGWAFGN